LPIDLLQALAQLLYPATMILAFSISDGQTISYIVALSQNLCNGDLASRDSGSAAGQVIGQSTPSSLNPRCIHMKFDK